jgi:hypothetical protein
VGAILLPGFHLLIEMQWSRPVAPWSTTGAWVRWVLGHGKRSPLETYPSDAIKIGFS